MKQGVNQQEPKQYSSSPRKEVDEKESSGEAPTRHLNLFSNGWGEVRKLKRFEMGPMENMKRKKKNNSTGSIKNTFQILIGFS